MKIIIDAKIEFSSVSLKKPIKTALRMVNSIQDLIVKVITYSGNVGYGEAPPTADIWAGQGITGNVSNDY